MGIQVTLLFLDLGFVSEPAGPRGGVVDDFFVLFKLMVDPDLNTRLTAKESYDIFMELINKHNITVGNKKMKITRKRFNEIINEEVDLNLGQIMNIVASFDAEDSDNVNTGEMMNLLSSLPDSERNSFIRIKIAPYKK